MNLNKVLLIGNLTRDPELKVLPSGSNVCNFSIATNRRWKDKSGQMKEEVQFHNCVAFGRTAEVIAQYMKKGAGIYVEGRLQTRSWDDKGTGAKRYATEIFVEQMQFGPRPSGAGGDYGQSTPQSRALDSDKPDMTPTENLPVIQEDEPEIEVKDIPF